MKVTIIEGSPEELAEYEARTGVIGQGRDVEYVPQMGDEPMPVSSGQAITGIDPDDEVVLRAFIFGRARTPGTGGHVETYVRRVLDLDGAVVEKGTSKNSKDGFADYLLVYDAGPRRYGAVAYVNAKNGGLTLRLTKNDVADVMDRVGLRDVQPGNAYQINCPLKTVDSIDLAVQLTQRALGKVRGDRNTG